MPFYGISEALLLPRPLWIVMCDWAKPAEWLTVLRLEVNEAITACVSVLWPSSLRDLHEIRGLAEVVAAQGTGRVC